MRVVVQDSLHAASESCYHCSPVFSARKQFHFFLHGQASPLRPLPLLYPQHSVSHLSCLSCLSPFPSLYYESIFRFNILETQSSTFLYFNFAFAFFRAARFFFLLVLRVAVVFLIFILFFLRPLTHFVNLLQLH